MQGTTWVDATELQKSAGESTGHGPKQKRPRIVRGPLPIWARRGVKELVSAPRVYQVDEHAVRIQMKSVPQMAGDFVMFSFTKGRARWETRARSHMRSRRRAGLRLRHRLKARVNPESGRGTRGLRLSVCLVVTSSRTNIRDMGVARLCCLGNLSVPTAMVLW